MPTKQFESIGDIILPALRGLVRASPWLTLIESERVVFAKPSVPKVTLISGGGSGHEPTHAGFVGEGLLDAAVAGHIFASPSTTQIWAGLKAIESPKGTLIVVKNYTGDIIHFGLVAERAKAQGHKVEMVVVGDDVSVGKTQGGKVGRRGLAGTILVHKIAGAAAAQGLELAQVANIARSVVQNLVTIAASLDHCNVPGRHFESNLGADEIEIGMGIHNEPGVRKSSPVPSIPRLVDDLLELLLSPQEKDRWYVPFSENDDIILLINNLGGMSNLEVMYATELVTEKLKRYNIVPKRTTMGAFITALNGPGFSITLLNASRAGAKILELFDAPARAIGWNQTASTIQWDALKHGELSTALGPSGGHAMQHKSPVSVEPELFQKILECGIKAVFKEEPRITLYDTIAGDGDCGETLVSGGNAIVAGIKDKTIRLDDGVNAIADIAEVVEHSMGGTSGGLYAIFLSALAQGVLKSGHTSLSLGALTSAARYALDCLYQYTQARVGDHTLIDALAPFITALENGEGLPAAVAAAADGTEKTRKLAARFGRASYVDREELVHFDHDKGLPDPGAVGLTCLLEGFLNAYN
jgi:dihydroxyacetone kinase